MGSAGQVLLNLGKLATFSTEYDRAQAFFSESLTLSRRMHNQPGILDGLLSLGVLASYRGEWIAARSRYDESLILARKLGDRARLLRTVINNAQLYGNYSQVTGQNDDLRLVQALYEESVVLAKEAGDQFVAATATFALRVRRNGS